MVHLFLHAVVPALVARTVDSARWLSATLIMMGTMLVDLDHLVAEPIYDAQRCSIGFHPFHTPLPIGLYMAVALTAGVGYRVALTREARHAEHWRALFFLGCGLVIHMALDGLDCVT